MFQAMSLALGMEINPGPQGAHSLVGKKIHTYILILESMQRENTMGGKSKGTNRKSNVHRKESSG